VTASPVNSTGTNGIPAGAAGSAGSAWASTLTLIVRDRASGSASITSTDHIGRPVALSVDWTNRSAVLASKSRTASNPPAM